VFILGDSSTAEFTMNQSTPGEDETIKSKSTETREITLSVSETGNEDINTYRCIGSMQKKSGNFDLGMFL
jgi:hypothetical protein